MEDLKISINKTDFNTLLLVESAEEISKDIYLRLLNVVSGNILKILYVDNKDGITNISFSINSMINVKEIMDKKEFNSKLAEKLFRDLFAIQKKFINNLIPIENLALDINYIYYSINEEVFYFLFIPFENLSFVKNTISIVNEVKIYLEKMEMLDKSVIKDMNLYASSSFYSLKGLHDILLKEKLSFENNRDISFENEIEKEDFDYDVDDETVYSFDDLEEDDTFDEVFCDNVAIENEETTLDMESKKYLFLAILFELVYNTFLVIFAYKLSSSFEKPLQGVLGIVLVFTLINVIIVKNLFLEKIDYKNFLIGYKNKFKTLDKSSGSNNAHKSKYGKRLKNSDETTLLKNKISTEYSGLILYRKDTDENYFLSKDSTIIGRNKDVSDIVLDDETVGREHAVIKKEINKYCIIDFGSLNGTFINGERIKSKKKNFIKNGDVLSIANIEFEIKLKIS